MYDTIVVGTDGSGSANRAVVHAIDLAETYGSTLHGIFVVDRSIYSEPALGSSELATHAIEEQGDSYLGDIARRAADLDVDYEKRCCHGIPHQEIVRYADQIDADLIVLGYQGQTHDDRKVLGNVSDRVVRTAGRPTLIV